MKTYQVEVHDNGDKRWYFNGKLHREDGASVEYANGDKHWYINGKLHREDGPAVEGANGYKAWYRNNEPHRENGPAIEYPNGDKFWYINGKPLTKKEFNLHMSKKQSSSCSGKIVKIDGKKYKLTEV